MLPSTCTMLLDGLLREEPGRTDGVWAEFDGRYRPVLYGFAQRAGLGAEDGLDLAQDVLVTFVQEFRAGRYDRQRGRLRGWLFAIARARVKHHHRRAGRAALQGLSSAGELPGEDDLETLWDDEWRRAVLRAALDELASRARQDDRSPWILEQVVVEGRAPADVAEELGTTPAAVHSAKYRALGKLRGILERLEDEW